MIDSREIIKDDRDQWEAFSEKVEMLEPEELEAINDRLRTKVPAGAHWTSYRDAFSYQDWWDFTEAYEHVMATAY